MVRASRGSKSRFGKAATTFESSDVETWQETVGRSTFGRMFGPLFEAQMSKIARRCGAKHICKSKCKEKKTNGFGPLFQVPIGENGTPLWREAHFQVKMYKAGYA